MSWKSKNNDDDDNTNCMKKMKNTVTKNNARIKHYNIKKKRKEKKSLPIFDSTVPKSETWIEKYARV